MIKISYGIGVKWKKGTPPLVLARESTGDRWIPPQRASDAELWCIFVDSLLKLNIEKKTKNKKKTIKLSVIWNAVALMWRLCYMVRWAIDKLLNKISLETLSMLLLYRTFTAWIIRVNLQVSQCNCPISHNAPFRTEMYTFLFWMVHRGIWDRYIVGLPRSPYCLHIISI